MNKDNPGIVQARRQCKICYEIDEIPSRTPTRTCSHLPQVCSRCLRELTNQILRRAQVANLCPTVGCESKFSDEDLERWADAAVWQGALVTTLGSDELFVKCANGGCPCGQYHIKGDQEPIVKCHSCGAKQCFIHRVPWHENMTCAQWKRQESRKNNDLSRIRVIKETKKCPQCKVPIHKRDGCDLMTCRCGFEFCYACRAPYDLIRRRGNHYHRSRCPHFRSKSDYMRDKLRTRWWKFWDSRWWRRARWAQSGA